MGKSATGRSLSDPESHQGRAAKRQAKLSEAAALKRLADLRGALLSELDRLERDPDYLQGQPAHECCTRRWNQMRITPLEARAIEQAFQRDPELKLKLGGVLQRLRRELPGLRDNDERQSFDCPLLDGTRCLVHMTAKPIGCLAWHPAVQQSGEAAQHYTEFGWESFETRDSLNDAVHGSEWKARVIPLWLRRVLATELARSSNLEALDQLAAPPPKDRRKDGPRRR